MLLLRMIVWASHQEWQHNMTWQPSLKNYWLCVLWFTSSMLMHTLVQLTSILCWQKFYIITKKYFGFLWLCRPTLVILNRGIVRTQVCPYKNTRACGMSATNSWLRPQCKSYKKYKKSSVGLFGMIRSKIIPYKHIPAYRLLYRSFSLTDTARSNFISKFKLWKI